MRGRTSFLFSFREMDDSWSCFDNLNRVCGSLTLSQLTFSFSLEWSSELLWLEEPSLAAPPPCAEGAACWAAASAVATSSRLLGDSSSCSRLRGEEHRDWKRGESAPSRSAGAGPQDCGVLERDGALGGAWAGTPAGTGRGTAMGPAKGKAALGL